MKNTRKIVLLFWCLITFLLSDSLSGQFFYSFGTDLNYWEHTHLWGGSMNIGLEYKYQRFSARTSFGIGYGKKNRLKNFPQVDFNNADYIYNLAPGKNFKDPNVNSDYALQEMYDLSLGFRIFARKNINVNLTAGVFYSDIRHHYIIDYEEYYKIDIFNEYKGGLFQISQQRFYTLGTRYELNADIKRSKMNITPHATYGKGPNYTDFFSVGVRISGLIRFSD